MSLLPPTTPPEAAPLGSGTALDRMAGFMSGIADRNVDLSNALTARGLGPTEIYFPPETIAGCCPYVEGREGEMAWQAAAEALDSERLHYVYTVHDGMVWFLAVKSSELASHSNSWCPFAALLPGQSNAQPVPALYIYEEDGVAMLLTAAFAELHIHRGATTIIRAKADRLSRDLGQAPIVNLLPETLDQLPVVAWLSASLLEDRARRFLASAGVLSGLTVAVLAFVIWLLTTFASLAVHHDVKSAQAQSEVAVQDLMKQAMQLRVSPLRGQLARFSELNEQLISMGGWLKSYSITGSKIEWKAVLPPAITADRITQLGARTQDVTSDGIIVVGTN